MPANMSIRRFVDRFTTRNGRCFGTNGYTVAMLGLDDSGKTTLLQRLSGDGIATTTPPTGINLESATVYMQGVTDMPVTIRSWDVGGTGKRQPLAFVLHCTETKDVDALIWLVNSSVHEWRDESVEEFQYFVERLKYPDINAKSEIPILILATKHDLPTALPLDEVQIRFSNVAGGRPVLVIGVDAVAQSLSEGTLPAGLRWLLNSVENLRAGRLPPPSPEDPRSPVALAIKHSQWIPRAEADVSTTKFLHQFENSSFARWDHYTTIRIVYSLLTELGRVQGRDRILRGIERSAKARGQPFNVTMIYFWIQVIHFAITSIPMAKDGSQVEASASNDSLAYLERMLEEQEKILVSDARSVLSVPGSDWTFVDDDGKSMATESVAVPPSAATLPEADDSEHLEEPDTDFIRFLLLSPYVADEELWTEYYSRDVMMSAKARARMVLPDKKRLPNLVGKDVISRTSLLRLG